MSGFGNFSFGSFNFGDQDFGLKALWESIPVRIRNLDPGNNDVLFKLIRSFADEYNVFTNKLLDIYNQIEPYKVLRKHIDISLDHSEEIFDEYWGNAIKFYISPGEDISEIGVYWTLKVGKDRFTIVRIRRRNEPETLNEILCLGKSKPDPDVAGVYTFYSPDLLSLLYSNLRIPYSDTDREKYKQGFIDNIFEILRFKTNKEFVRLLGLYTGWNINIKGLWRITEEYANMLDPSVVFNYGGTFYTTEEPIFVRFDDIPVDTEFNDPDEGVVALQDNYVLYDTTGGDGMSPAKYFSMNIFVANDPVTPEYANIISVTPLTSSQLDTYGINYGSQVVIDLSWDMYKKIGYVSKSIFALRDLNNNEEFIIFTEVSYNKPLHRWTVIIEEPFSHVPNLGDHFGLRYYPEVAINCEWCKSHKVIIELEPVLGYNPCENMLVSEAINSIVSKIRYFLPIHTEILDVIYDVSSWVGTTC